MRLAKGILAWLLFILGDLCSRIEWLDRGWLTGPAYQWLMRNSGHWQDRAGWGPWRDVRQEDT
jgi:hypothetical protein